MRAVVLESKGTPLLIKDIPEPTPNAGDAVLQVLSVPVLSYAKHFISGSLPYPTLLPLVPGVSCVGRIHSLGPGAASLKPGQLVYFDFTVRARDRPSTIMLQGLFASDHNGGQTLQQYWRNGSWAEKVLVPIENIHPLPETLLDRYAVTQLTEINTVMVPYGGLLAGGLEAGQRVMIQPATGHFGAAAVAVAVAMGASVVYAVGRNVTVLNELVDRFGPRVKPIVVQGTKEDTEVYASLDVDMTLNLYPPGTPSENVGYGMAALKEGGTLVLMGGIVDPVTFPYGEMMQKCLTVKGQFMFPPSAIKKMIGMVESGVLDLSAFEQKVFKFEDVLEAVEVSASGDNRGWLYSVVMEM